MTEMTKLQQYFWAELPNLKLLLDEPLSRHTSFRIGGPAEIMAFPKSREEASAVLRAARNIGVKPVILGAGSNVLAPDEGMRGLIICTKGSLQDICRTGPAQILAQAGASMARAALFAAEAGLSGLEFAHGIPGTVGGGVYMNAGAYGGEICQVAIRSMYCDEEGNPGELAGEAQGFSYRHSAYCADGHLITGVEFQLTPDDPERIRERMRELAARRRASQPLELPSAGSTFKRPVGGYAAALIDQCGLKGFRVGDAAVSEKHAGFVVNLGHATAADVLHLIAEIQRRILEETGIRLEPEVRIIGQEKP